MSCQLVVRLDLREACTAFATLAQACDGYLRAWHPRPSAPASPREARCRARADRPAAAVSSRDAPVGIVTLGDLAVERDPGAALGSISAAGSNT